MIFDIGFLILIAAFVLAAFGVVIGYFGGQRRNTKLIDSSYHAVYAVAALVSLATFLLWYGLLTDAFELSYVWNHSERALPIFYKFSALWGGQAGSLLFWCWISRSTASLWRLPIASAIR
jgi:cytochrome c-type biogenesis protein CcmF